MTNTSWFWLGWLCCSLFVLGMSCINEAEQRQQWQDCAGVYHEICAGDLDCEYEFYKECINGSQARPDGG